MSDEKDWAKEAAFAIATVFTDTPSVSVNWIAPLIKRLCPFESDVVYMPVPRCDSCSYWKASRGSAGWCGVKRTKIGTSPGANLITTKDFGCVEWKKK